MDIYFKHEDMKAGLNRVAPLFIKKGVNHKAFPYAAVQFIATPEDIETEAYCQLTASIDTDVAIQTHVPLQACHGAGTMVASHRDMARHFKTHAALCVLRKTQSSPFYMLSRNTAEETELRVTGDTLLGGVFPVLDASLLQANGAFYRNDILQACNFVKHAISENLLPAQPRTPTERALGSVLFTPSAEKECTEVVATDGNLLAVARIAPMITHPFLVPAFLASRLKTIFKGDDVPVYKVIGNKASTVLSAGSTRILCLDSNPVDFPPYLEVLPDFQQVCRFETERQPLMAALKEFAEMSIPVTLQISPDCVHVAAMSHGKTLRRASLLLTQSIKLPELGILSRNLIRADDERVFQCQFDSALLLRALNAFAAQHITLACQLPAGPVGIWNAQDSRDVETAKAFLLLNLRT